MVKFLSPIICVCFLLDSIRINNINTIPIRRPIQKSSYFTGMYPASEKVVTVILLARIRGICKTRNKE